MNKNPKILMVFAVIILTGVVGLFILGGGKGRQHPPSSNNKQDIYDVASGDTNNETLRTLIAGQQRLEKENKDLREQNNDLTKKGLSVYQQKFEEEKNALNAQFSNEKSKLFQQIKLANKADKAVSRSDKYHLNGQGTVNPSKIQAIGDISDMSQQNAVLDGSGTQKDMRSAASNNSKPNLPSHYTGGSSENGSDNQSFYTIPSNATLAKTTLMTNIIGEVPVSGKLVEPAMPFKGIIGKKDLLASNGMKLPEDLGGIVISGYSVGNMSLSCARMYVTQVLFTFQDGSFTVYPKENKVNGNDIYPKDALGYLSDKFGNVCLTGQYITDAPKVIASLTAFGGMAGFGQYTAQSQTTTYSDADSSSTEMTGDALKYGLGNAVGTGSDTALKWYTQRVSDIFDAVYIPKMTNDGKTLREFVFNATQTIPIDVSDKSRKLQYDNLNNNNRKPSDLD